MTKKQLEAFETAFGHLLWIATDYPDLPQPVGSAIMNLAYHMVSVMAFLEKADLKEE